MMKNRHIIILFLMLLSADIFAQKEERDFVRKGNRAYTDSIFVDAEVNYRKALEINPQSAIAMYNLGNSLSNQQKFKEAMEQYNSAANIEKDKMKLSEIYHNMGVLFQAAQDYAQAVDVYKKALRNNPKDDETRYNLALTQKLLKDQQQDQQNQDDNQQEKEQEKEQEQKKDQNQEQNQDQQQPETKDSNNEMSRENAEQMLNSVMQDEKKVQEKVKKQQIIQTGPLEKDW